MSDTIDRRGFLKISATAGAGLVVAVYLGACDEAPSGPPALPAEPTGEPTSGVEVEPTPTREGASVFDPNIYLRIDKSGEVTIVAFRSEMGQGVRTAIAMIVGEELDVDWDKVLIEQAPADPAYGEQVTGGSQSISRHYSLLRQAGAAARHVFVSAAARTWGVEPDACRTENGQVIGPGGERLTYGELVATAAELEAPGRGDIRLKEPADFRLIGADMGHWDAPQIVTGSAVFGMDVRLPGMLYATVAQCPVFGGRLASYKAGVAEAFPGVRQVLEISDGLAVVAENTWAAFQGRLLLEIEWEEGGGQETSSEGLLGSLEEGMRGRVDSLGEDIVHAAYANPYLAHATMEPMNCTADVSADRCEIWAPTQNPQAAKGYARSLTGLAEDAITVHVPLIGGGFGRRLEVDYVRQAVEISREVGAPIQLVWRREEDMQHDYYHPLGYHLVSSKRDEPPLPKASTQQGRANVPTGAWRSVSNFHEALARECFLDELAHELGRDPYELRMELYSSLDRAVVQMAAEKAGWGEPLPEGWGRGIAFYSTFNVTPVAHVAEVSVDSVGNVRVHRVVCAVECGTVVNPDNVRAQMEGGIAFGLTAALKAGITIEGGRVVESNFHDYPLLRFDEMPVVETHIVPSDRPPSGIGEMGVPPIAPAVLNAIFAATGVRVRRIPVRAKDLR